MLDPDVPTSVLESLLLDEQDGEDLDLQKVICLMHSEAIHKSGEALYLKQEVI